MPANHRIPRKSPSRFAGLALIAVLLGTSACTPHLADANVSRVIDAPVVNTEYRLGGGDKISINVFGETNITGIYPVDATGAVSLPLAGRVEVRDMTPKAVEQAIATRLRDGIVADPKVSVSVTEYRPFYVVGEVANPGAYSFFNGFTVLNAIALAGGQTYRADLSNISIIRHSNANGTGQAQVTESRNGRAMGTLASIQPGDVVVVPERTF